MTAKKPVVKGKKRQIKSDKVNSTVGVFVYPNKGKDELDSALVSVSGKDTWLKSLSEHKLDISTLKLHDLVKQFYTGFANMQLSGIKFAYKRVYGLSFGFALDRPSSYKCAIAHHNANGLRALVFNQSGLMTLEQIDAALDKQGISSEKQATYRVVQLSKENLAKVSKATIQLLKLKAVG